MLLGEKIGERVAATEYSELSSKVSVVIDYSITQNVHLLNISHCKFSLGQIFDPGNGHHTQMYV